MTGMPIAPEMEWTLIACGLIAHADGVLDGAECDRLLSLIDEELDADDYSDWLARIGDKDALEARLDELPAPAPRSHREVLEQAWSMAMVDGDRCEAELDVLNELAFRLGVEPMQLEFWREAWTTNERGFSEWAARGAALVLGGGAALSDGDRMDFDDLIAMLPTSEQHREELRRWADGNDETIDAAGRSLAGLPRTRRRQLLKLIAPLVLESPEEEAARVRFRDLAAAAGIMPDESERIFEIVGRSRL
jgi:tellurite resistance protein